MFTENEIANMIEDPDLLKATQELYLEFRSNAAPMLELSEHDFFSLILLTPSISIALANGTISLFEELSLNKKARRFSKGGYFLKVDPVCHSMKYLIKNFDGWEDRFYQVIRQVMDKFFGIDEMMDQEDRKLPDINIHMAIMKAPYIFIRALPTFFLMDDEDITEIRAISRVEYEKILEIGTKLGLDSVPIYQKFCQTFELR